MVSKKNTILVTGASGFIGSNLCKVLVNSGAKVRAFYRPRPNQQVPSLINGIDLEHCPGDITDPRSLGNAFEGVNVVFHTAAKLGSTGNPETLYRSTVEGTRNVLEAARKTGVRRVVHTSSIASLGIPGYGNPSILPTPVNETHTWNAPPAMWLYGHAKYLAEMVVQEAVTTGMDIVMVNPGVVVGAGDINRIGSGVVIQIAHRKIPFLIPGGLNVIHIQDVVRGQLAALEYGRPGERYILGGENLTFVDFYKKIARIAGVNPPRVLVPAKLLHMFAKPLSHLIPMSASTLRRSGYYFYYQNEKARQHLHIEEFLSTEQAIQDAYSWYKENGMID